MSLTGRVVRHIVYVEGCRTCRLRRRLWGMSSRELWGMSSTKRVVGNVINRVVGHDVRRKIDSVYRRWSGSWCIPSI